MNSIVGSSVSVIEIKKSEFITSIKNVNSVQEAKEFIELISNKHSDARHNCYAYIVGSKEKCSDDKEPSGTAGLPILNVLEHNNMGNIVCVVSRYFGGIKLGAGGLVRAYSKSASNALLNAKIVSLVKGVVISISFDYTYNKIIDYNLKKYNILSKEYLNKVVYNLHIKKNDYKEVEKILKEINHLIEIKILKELDIIDE